MPLLVIIRFHQVKHAALGELRHGLVAVDEVIGIEVAAAPHVLGLRIGATAGQVVHVGIAERQEVQRHVLEGRARLLFTGNPERQRVGPEADFDAVMDAGIE
jgi:hypothetical protein